MSTTDTADRTAEAHTQDLAAADADRRLAAVRDNPEITYGPVVPTLCRHHWGWGWWPAPECWPFAFPEDNVRHAKAVALLKAKNIVLPSPADARFREVTL